mgnify:CR=1 FL=1
MDKQIYTLLKTISHKHKFSLSELKKLLNSKKSASNLDENISWLIEHKYIEEDPDCMFISQTPNTHIEYEPEYSLTVLGRIYLYERRIRGLHYVLSEIRNWTAFVLSILSFVLSICNIFF